jgi:hypothetical protein
LQTERISPQAVLNCHIASVAALNLDDVWQWHTPLPEWGLVQLQLPAGFSGSEVLDGRLKGPIPTRVLEDAARYGDTVATGWASVMVISPAVQAVLAPYEGWEPIPLSSSESRLRGYAALSINGRIGPITEDGGGLGSFVDPSTWDGKALFKPENRRGVWTTGDVASALRKARPRGLEIDRHVSWEAR